MADQELSREFQAIYDAWGQALVDHDLQWFEERFADNFLGTAQPWPTLVVNREQMLELQRNNVKMDAKVLGVTAERYGDVVLAKGVVEYREEEFKPGATIGEGMPTGEDLAGLVNGNRVLYIGAWRRNGETWQIFDHHMVGIVEGFEAAT
jgi:hypothetical protein